MAKHEIRIGDQTIALDDREFDVQPIGNGTYSVSDGKRRWRVAVAGPADDRWVFTEGRVARIEIVPRGGARPRRRSAALDMTAPMPATVVKVLVAQGGAVKKGDTVLMLEAMKMEMPVRAARDGVVRTILCREGELVQPDAPLVELEE